MSTYRATHPQDLTSYGYGWDVWHQKFFLWVDKPQIQVGEKNPQVWFMDELDELVAKARDEALVLYESQKLTLNEDKKANR